MNLQGIMKSMDVGGVGQSIEGENGVIIFH